MDRDQPIAKSLVRNFRHMILKLFLIFMKEELNSTKKIETLAELKLNLFII